MTEFVMEKMTKEWERIGMNQMCKDIKDKIRYSIKVKEKKKETFIEINNYIFSKINEYPDTN
jgi:hypothetical protein